MAKPAFIYAFDNLGPYKFAELCGELLGSRYNGFMLGGVGADGGIDAEIDKVLGIWHPETKEPLLNEIIQSGETVVFQFKHKVSARIGQAQTRTQLLNLYKCNTSHGKVCELHSKLVREKKPTSYILVTNVEINSQFRDTFINQCKSEEANINHYQVIGLDELVSWVETMPELRQQYFPTIFGIPRFDLRVKISHAFTVPYNSDSNGISLEVQNVGTVPSYLDANAIKLFCIANGKEQGIGLYLDNEFLRFLNPTKPIMLNPGRRQSYFFPQSYFAEIIQNIESWYNTKEKIFPVEIQVHDEIGNIYRGALNDDLRNTIIQYIYTVKLDNET
jgi:hypothetical protein